MKTPHLEIMDRLNAGEFEHKLPWGSRKSDPARHAAFAEETSEIATRFRAALECAYGIAAYPQELRDSIYSKAYDAGHSSGYSEVAIYYDDFAEVAIAAYTAGALSVSGRS